MAPFRQLNIFSSFAEICLTVSKKIIVVKFGTAAITRSSGEPDLDILKKIAAEVASVHPDYHVIIVSSGAVGAGKSFIRKYKGTLSQRKAAASIGNPLLINIYSEVFKPFGIPIAQGLCERRHFADRGQFLQLKDTFEELWRNGVIPIVNENDVVSSRELKFSDNDELATLLAAGFGAEALMLCTSVGGVLDETGGIIAKVSDVNEVFRFVRTDKSFLGLGGMASKLTFAKLATRMGIRVVIFGMSDSQGLLRALKGETGTELQSGKSTLSARNRWLGSGGLISGKLQVDAGAERAVLRRNSLLAVGVTNVAGEFESGEIVEVTNLAGDAIAVARARVASADLVQNLKTLDYEVAHANDIVVL